MYDIAFKKFSHQQRINTSEEFFNRGMNYTNTPIEAGQANIMLNFDISNDGTSLKPRAGIRVSSAYVLPTKEPSITLPDFNEVNISSIGEYFYNDKNYIYVVLHYTKTHKIYLCTLSDDIKVTDINDVQTYGAEIIETNLTCHYNDFSTGIIHDLQINKDTALAQKQIGTKAWNGLYFFFSGKTLYTVKFNTDTLKFYIEQVTPTKLSALEASPNKFNMLLDQPYNFVNEIAAGTFVLKGVLCYDRNDLIVSPRINKEYTYKLNYSAPAGSYKILWEWKDYNGTEFTKLKEESITINSAAPEISCKFAAPIKNSLMRVSITKTGDQLPAQVSAIGINCDAEAQPSTANTSLATYKLSDATGMCYWQNRLVLWGFDEPILFVSETNLPEWFPYPNNIDLFEEPIIHCEPYLDKLLVFTATKLFQLNMLADGSGWTKSCIQEHLNLTKYDTNFIKTIKNMVFYKSGNSYYMVVPAANLLNAGGLKIAPISKPIQWMLDNFNKAVTDIIADVYNYRDSLTLEYCFNYINNADIVIDYIFKDEKGILINFCLLYDTEDRTWRVHIFESQTVYTMFKLDATTDGTLVTLTPIKQRFSETAEKDSFLFQFFTKDDNNPKDLYIIKDFKKYPAIGSKPDISSNIEGSMQTVHQYKNYQYLDTGYRTLDYPNNKKRHREFQIRFNNKSEKTLSFGTSFYIDGEDRRNMYEYVIDHNTDIDSENYGVITVVPKLVRNVIVPGTTILGDAENNINCWTLNVSQFPQVPLIKARVAVSGKGYNNRLKLLSINEEDFEILGLCWVYKIMNLR